jgi:hypothetical protein
MTSTEFRLPVELPHKLSVYGLVVGVTQVKWENSDGPEPSGG